MSGGTLDSQILVQERAAIELLARDTHTAIAEVQEIFLAEYARLAPNAHIKSFLPLLVSNRVRVILQSKSAPDELAPKL
jgi:hypothetical protein